MEEVEEGEGGREKEREEEGRGESGGGGRMCMSVRVYEYVCIDSFRGYGGWRVGWRVGWSRMESDGGSEKGWRREGSALEPMRRSFSGG